jgi:hypothetical protein
MRLPIQFEKTLAFALIMTGVIVIILAIFQAYYSERELSVFGGTLKEKGLTNFESLGQNLMWFFTVLTELVGGFFLASIGMKIIKK